MLSFNINLCYNLFRIGMVSVFGAIKKITDNVATVIINKTAAVMPDLMNMHVVFVSGNQRILGEVKDIAETTVDIKFLGEFTDKGFITGILRKPTLDSKVRMINEQELQDIIGTKKPDNFLLGYSPLYNNYPIYVRINDLFANHFAILGSTGSGKSCGTARIIQNVFSNPEMPVPNANLIFFDAYGEYKNAFRDINKINGQYNYKFVTTNKTEPTDEDLSIPIYLLTLDDIALLLNASQHSQITLLERAMKLVRIFARKDEASLKLQNHLIAKALVAILFSSMTNAGKKNEIFKLINNTHTPQFSFNTEIQGLGFSRSFSDCFELDSNGQFAESVLINEYVLSFIDESLETNMPEENQYFTIRDFEIALDFTLISEGIQENNEFQDAATMLQVRLHTIVNSGNKRLFDYPDFITLDEFISRLVVHENTRCQIVNINLEGLDDALAKVMVKIFSRMLFDFAKNRPQRASTPFHLFLEEAHRYVQKDSDTFLIGYNIFDRIAKEGRKYGVLLDIITQRPVELSDTVVSQISNFLIFKMTHPADIAYIEKMLPGMSVDIIEKLSSLQPGTNVSFGTAFKIPFINRMQMPNPGPYSSSADVANAWK